jgi:hypothetical protein
MTLNGSITQIQRERDKPFLYMPNPTLIHPRTIKIDHYLKIVDFYIHTGCPDNFIPEPPYKEYKPDVYMKDQKGNPICVEIQITPISTKKMQQKIDQFVSSYGKEHDAKILLLVTNNDYGKVKVPPTFKLIKLPLPNEPYGQKETLSHG